jgi:MGT family glycosyltransferase
LNIIITCVPATGHINPMLSIAKILISDGHEVVGLGPTTFSSRFTRIGARFCPFPASIDRDLSDINSVFPERKNLRPGPELLRFDFNRLFIEPMPAQRAALRNLLQDFPADLILCDSLFLGTLPMLLGPRLARPAIVHCGTTALFTARDDGAPFGPGLPLATSDEQRREYQKIHDDISEQFLDPVQQSFNRTLEGLGCGSITMPIMDAIVKLPDMFLQCSVPEFEYPNREKPETVQFIGALPQPHVDVPLPEWAGELDGSRRVVLITQGTVSNHDLCQLVAPALAALADRPDLLVVATTGGRPLDTLPGMIPANARVSRFLPMEWLMPHVELVVTNGGYGNVSQALNLGIPLIVAGTTEDKAEVAALVAWSGAGINLKTSTPTVAALREAVTTMLDGTSYRAKARALAQDFARYDAKRKVPSLLTTLVSSFELQKLTLATSNPVARGVNA